MGHGTSMPTPTLPITTDVSVGTSMPVSMSTSTLPITTDVSVGTSMPVSMSTSTLPITTEVSDGTSIPVSMSTPTLPITTEVSGGASMPVSMSTSTLPITTEVSDGTSMPVSMSTPTLPITTEVSDGTSIPVSMSTSTLPITAQVLIKIDKGVDENQISSTEEFYPYPSPQTKDTNEITTKDTFFVDEEFNHSNDDADLFETEQRGGKRPRRFTFIKDSFTFKEVDEHAKQAGFTTLGSFKDLADYLSLPWKHDTYRKIKVARAIVMWMSQQNLGGENFGKASMETPSGLLQYLKERRMTYPTCYAILCRKAGLQCTIIKGFVKAEGYEPGEESVPHSNWNAVYCECGWQIVHPFWICRSLYDNALNGWVKVESDGTRTHQGEKTSFGVVQSTFQERYFMPKPEEFLYECCAQPKAWQLVKPNKEVISKADFLSLPYLLPPFHSLGLQLVSEHKCVYECKEGFCRIEFKGRTTTSRMLVLRYDFFQKDTSDEETEPTNDTSRMVFNYREKERFIFDIRFPAKGVYKLVIYGGPFKSGALRLCEFKIVCKEGMNAFNLLPLSCGDIGWGPGPATMKAGLLMPSKSSGLIPANKKLHTEIKFQIRDDYVSIHKYSATMHVERESKIYVDESDTVTAAKDTMISKDNHINLTITDDFEFVIIVQLPEEGECGVTIHEHVDNKTQKTICNYLVSTLVYQEAFLKANLKNAKQDLVTACSKPEDITHLKTKIEEMERTLEKLKKQTSKDKQISDYDEDVCVAETRLEFLKYKDMLHDCIRQRNYNVAMKTLASIERYKNKAALTNLTKNVENLRKKLWIDGTKT